MLQAKSIISLAPLRYSGICIYRCQTKTIKALITCRCAATSLTSTGMWNVSATSYLSSSQAQAVIHIATHNIIIFTKLDALKGYMYIATTFNISVKRINTHNNVCKLSWSPYRFSTISEHYNFQMNKSLSCRALRIPLHSQWHNVRHQLYILHTSY